MNSNLLCNDVWRLIESFIPEENNLQTTSKYFKQILPTRIAHFDIGANPYFDRDLKSNEDVVMLYVIRGEKECYRVALGYLLKCFFPNVKYLRIDRICEEDIRNVLLNHNIAFSRSKLEVVRANCFVALNFGCPFLYADLYDTIGTVAIYANKIQPTFWKGKKRIPVESIRFQVIGKSNLGKGSKSIDCQVILINK